MADPWSNYKRAAAEVAAGYVDPVLKGVDYLSDAYEAPKAGLIGYLESESAPELLRVRSERSSGYDAAAVKGAIEAGLWFTPLGVGSKLIKGAGMGSKFARALLTPAALPIELAAGAGAGTGIEAARRYAPESVAAQLAGGLAGSLATVGALRAGVAAARGARAAVTSTAARPSVAPDAAQEGIEATVKKASEQVADQSADMVAPQQQNFAFAEEMIAEPAPWAGQSLNDFRQTATQMGVDAFQQADQSILNRQSIETATNLAGSMPWDEDQIGKVLLMAQQNSPEMIGLSQMYGEAGQRFAAAQAAHLRNATEDTAAALMREADALAKVGEATQAIATGSGRALRAIQSQWARGVPAKRMIEQMGELKTLNAEEYVTALANMDLSSATRAGALSRFNPTAAQKFVEFWKMSLLSGPRTHFVNILGNTAFNIQNLVETWGEAALGGLVRGATLGRRGQQFARASDAMARTVGTIEGVVDAAKAFGPALIRETSEDLGKMELRRRAIPGRTGYWVRTPGRLLQAEDAVFKSVARKQELYEQARRVARQEARRDGLSRVQEMRRYREIIESGGTEEIQRAMEESALRLTFQQDLESRFGKSIQLALGSSPLAQMVVPFFRTPVNIYKQALVRTPVGILRGAKRRDPRMLAQGIVGTGIGIYWANEALQGRVTGSMPREPGKRAVWEQAGQKPYAIKAGDVLREWLPEDLWPTLGLEDGSDWVQYIRIEPAGSTIGIAADIAQMAMNDDTDAEFADYAGMATISFMQNLGSKTWLQGMSSLVNALTDPERYGGKWFEGYVGSVVPSLIAQPIQGMDDVQRDVDSVYDAILARVYPFALEPRTDILGREVPREALGPDVISPIYTATPSTDPVSKALLAMDANVVKPRRKLDAYRMTTAEYRRMNQKIGEIAYTALHPVMSSPNWEQIPDLDKESIVSSIYRRSRAAARNLLKAELLEAGIIRYNPEKRRIEGTNG